MQSISEVRGKFCIDKFNGETFQTKIIKFTMTPSFVVFMAKELQLWYFMG
jgi:hypothetical protein